MFASCGMSDSATKSQVTLYISKIMVQVLKEYEDANGKSHPNFTHSSTRFHSNY